MTDRDEISEWFRGLQRTLCEHLEAADERGHFTPDEWVRPGGGGGVSMVFTHGRIFEKGGVNFSAVQGTMPQGAGRALGLTGENHAHFFATGVSVVIHPHNPFVPIIHMNVRYFEVNGDEWWFGGGIDLTPHYIDLADAAHFHRQLKNVCDKHHASYYSEFKDYADTYFYIRHRNETRGVGGIFFDRLGSTTGFSKAARFEFVKDVGLAFPLIYTHLMKKNCNLPFGDAERQWQLMRRGRYVEFNLVYDRGTRFGLETEGRAESILMSLPPAASWPSFVAAPAGSREAVTLEHLKKGIEWIAAG